MKNAGITTVPKGEVDPNNTDEVMQVARGFWNQEQFPLDDQRVALAVLTQLCDSLVWWTQRYKKKSNSNKGKNHGEEE